MSQATHDNNIDSKRRRFISIAGAASAVAVGTLAAAAMPAVSHDLIGTLPASQCSDDGELLKLAKQIPEQRRLAQAYDRDLIRLCEVWEGETLRLQAEVAAGRSTLTAFERWDLVKAMPESAEHTRLTELQRPFWDRHDKAIDRMFALPAQTAEGRAAKAGVILGLMQDFMGVLEDDEDGEYPINFIRQFLIELGGKPGAVRSWQES